MVPGTAEQRVLDRLREALAGSDYRLYPNVRWIAKPDAHSPARDGETDLLLVHPERGLLIIEVKGGRIRRDGHGRWFSGEHPLEPPPFQQAETSKHNLVAKITSLTGWPGTRADLRTGHAVCALATSDVWRQRRFGNEVLWNGSYDEAGRSLGLSADEAPVQPTDTILFDSIRRFKGLEREVVVLVELDESDDKRDRLMYVGATRAKQHLVVVG